MVWVFPTHPPPKSCQAATKTKAHCDSDALATLFCEEHQWDKFCIPCSSGTMLGCVAVKSLGACTGAVHLAEWPLGGAKEKSQTRTTFFLIVISIYSTFSSKSLFCVMSVVGLGEHKHAQCIWLENPNGHHHVLQLTLNQ